MPSSPKRTPKTGSLLLGQELRRLRGGRTLRDVCALTRNPPLSGHVGLIAEASLCEIESGKTMPSLQTMHALSVVYRTSMSQLMAYVTEERLTAIDAGQLTPQVALEYFSSALSAGRWPEAAAIARLAEQRAESESARVGWRANRALALSSMGQRDEATVVLLACLESRALLADQRLSIVRNLADCLGAAGGYRAAALFAAEGIELAKSLSADSLRVAELRVLNANLTLALAQHGSTVPATRLRECQRDLDAAAAVWPATDPMGRLRIGLALAESHLYLGNALVAARDCIAVRDEASRIGNQLTEAAGYELLARIRLAQGRTDDAIREYEQAADRCEKDQQHELLFEVSYRLFKLLRSSRPGPATRHLHRCSELLPLLSATSPSVIEYEKSVRSRA